MVSYLSFLVGPYGKKTVLLVLCIALSLWPQAVHNTLYRPSTWYINITIYLSRQELSNLHAGIVSGLKLSTLKLPNRLTITDEGLCNLQGTDYKRL